MSLETLFDSFTSQHVQENSQARDACICILSGKYKDQIQKTITTTQRTQITEEYLQVLAKIRENHTNHLLDIIKKPSSQHD